MKKTRRRAWCSIRRRAWRSIRSHWQIRPGSTEAYLAAILFVVVASLVRWGLGRLGLLNAESLPYSTYYPAVLFGTVVGGTRAGAFAAILGGIIGWWAFTPQHLAFPPLTSGHFWLYIFASLLIVWGAGHGRKPTDQSRRFAKHRQDEEYLRKLTVEELGHRLKNKHATILSIISFQLREAPQLRTEISNRIIALSRTDDLIMASQGEGTSIYNILSTELGPYDLSRISMHGPDFSLPPRLALTMALIFHELATNAAKHGALSSAVGRLTIHWSLADRRLNFEWRESGGPLIASPTRRGFGLRLLSRALDQFSGAVDTTFEMTGLICKMKATLPESTPNIIADESRSRSPQPGTLLSSNGAILPHVAMPESGTSQSSDEV